MMCRLRSGMVYQPRMVCCTAEIRQMRRQEADGAVPVLALGRQRAEVVDDRHTARSQVSLEFSIRHLRSASILGGLTLLHSIVGRAYHLADC